MKAKTTGIALAAAFLVLTFSGASFAQEVDTLGGAADMASGAWEYVINLLTGIAYLAGVVFGIRTAILLKDHTDNPGQVRLSRPVTAMVACTLFMGLPSTVTTLVSTFKMDQFSYGRLEGKAEELSAVGVAQTSNDLSEMAVAFSRSLPELTTLVYLAATISGLALILRAVFLLPQLEQGRAEPSKVVWTLISGVLLWTILPALDMSLATMGSSNLSASSMTGYTSGEAKHVLSYSRIEEGGTGLAKFQNTMQAVLMFIQFLGMVAFFRGGLILKNIGEHKDGSMGRALTHIFGGAAALNIGWAVWILAHTIGAGWICSDTNDNGQMNPLAVVCKH